MQTLSFNSRNLTKVMDYLFRNYSNVFTYTFKGTEVILWDDIYVITFTKEKHNPSK